MKGRVQYFRFEVKGDSSYIPSQIRILVLCDVTLYCWVMVPDILKITHYLYLQGSVVFVLSCPLKMKVTHSFKKVQNQHSDSVTSQKTRIHDYIAVETSKLAQCEGI
jgi:hypothetical protein